MSEKKRELDASKIKIEGSSEQSYVELDGIKIRLAKPMELNFKWVGNRRLIDQMKACWFTAFSLYAVAPVRAVGQIEILFVLAISVIYFRERPSAKELFAMLLLAISIVMVLLG